MGGYEVDWWETDDGESRFPLWGWRAEPDCECRRAEARLREQEKYEAFEREVCRVVREFLERTKIHGAHLTLGARRRQRVQEVRAG